MQTLFKDINKMTLKSAAKSYAELLNYSVFPLMPKTKLPFSKSNGFKDATTDLAKIESWWTHHPNANIGIATGTISGIGVLDPDAKPTAAIVIANFEREFAKIPLTLRAVTGGDGFHHIFKIIEPIPTRHGIIQGLDFKSDGGYIVASPSIHPSGKRYAWDIFPGEPLGIAELPNWLSRILRSTNTKASSEPSPASFSYFDVVRGMVPDGKRTAALVSIIGVLLARRIDPYLTREIALSLNQTKFDPPLAREKVLRTLESIAKTEATKRKEKMK